MSSFRKGLIFNIQHYSLHDGPGIRTTVFMKGCPLSCLWCSNPESIRADPQIGFHKQKCVRDYRCREVCPLNAVSVSEPGGLPAFDRDTCSGCSERPCIAACISGALELRGKELDVDELWREVEADRLFYRNSGGGLTLSGGEPTLQPEFTRRFFRKCQEKGVHTVLDTSGYVKWEVLEEILEHTDLVLFDLKHMDSFRHRQLTGVPNEMILENADMISSAAKVPIIIRMPLIPGLNDSDSNIKSTAEFVKEIGAAEIILLPFHRLGMGKYEMIGRKYAIEDVSPPTEDCLSRISETFQSYEIACLF